MTEDSRVSAVVDRYWSRALGDSALVGDRGFFELGGDSLAAAEFIVSVSEDLNIELDFAQFFVDDRRSALVAQATHR